MWGPGFGVVGAESQWGRGEGAEGALGSGFWDVAAGGVGVRARSGRSAVG